MIRRVPRLVRLDHRPLWRLIDTGDNIEKSSEDTALLPNEGNMLGGRTENAAALGEGSRLLRSTRKKERKFIQSDRFAHPLVEGRTHGPSKAMSRRRTSFKVMMIESVKNKVGLGTGAKE